MKNEYDFPHFKGICDEEIGFIVVYFAGYIKDKQPVKNDNKILIVCHQGLIMSKSLEIQLYTYIPSIQIVDIVSLKDLEHYNNYYDYIISTIDIKTFKNVIVVKPILDRLDIDNILKKVLNISDRYKSINIREIMGIIRENTNIKNESKLLQELEQVLYKKNDKEVYKPMLKDIINKNRIQIVDTIQDWKDAIRLASVPLIDDGSIDCSYVDAMIENVEKNGPYIALADRFALPHASNKIGVNNVAMSLLIVKKEVDLIGKNINLFMVLATTDNKIHMKALASLSEILYDKKNIDILRTGTIEDVLEIINKYS